ncbi:AfsR/SARP family transcriptional regulator [Actinoplanes sp. CA-030573]|uniref:AfsR/SARP family transcriptional regulator n=1 Tax=Actinoplanes sp. CA-030573 TaxID=3239898 RepID=UPI003D941214
MFDIQLFGRIEVRTRGERLSGADFGGDRPRHLLALVALRGEVSISELAELLGTGKKSVEADLSVLRAHLEPGVTTRDSVLLTHRGRVRFDPDRVRVDVARFDELVTAAASRPAPRAIKPLTAAAFLASRPLLEEEDAPWAAEARSEYRAKLVMAAPSATVKS